MAAAARAAHPGDTVLLSPACASLDMFRDYAHRGEVFSAAVRALQLERPPTRLQWPAEGTRHERDRHARRSRAGARAAAAPRSDDAAVHRGDPVAGTRHGHVGVGDRGGARERRSVRLSRAPAGAGWPRPRAGGAGVPIPISVIERLRIAAADRGRRDAGAGARARSRPRRQGRAALAAAAGPEFPGVGGRARAGADLHRALLRALRDGAAQQRRRVCCVRWGC